ncbi:MAG: glutamine-hydrolyzing carbamoyl-phosphate synthase small subunit [Dehalococcoidia bacterium]|nr:glutamine-hydrolyzing carbamoyl-phosphate synthase small subunit [Dehalococcoidia bacterium]
MRSKRTVLVLEDGSFYEGHAFGAGDFAYGEVVFNTSMTGYQEMLTDPSYAGQILVLTYPLIGNYGVNLHNFESRAIQARGLVVREMCSTPSHRQSRQTLDEFLAVSGVLGIHGVDTRALTRRLRYRGVMMGAIGVNQTPQELLARLQDLPRYDDVDFVKEVSTKAPYRWEGHLSGEDGGATCGDGLEGSPGSVSTAEPKTSGFKKGPETQSADGPHIVVVDCGVKYNILRILRCLGCRVTVVPCTYSDQQILSPRPDGVLFSPGPGDPALLGYLVETVRGLAGVKPLMGICLGEQVIGQAFGGRTFKLKFGHRGGNHPVRDVRTGRVHIAAQNHGYAVDADTLKGGLEVSHVNLNDGTVEGLRHRELPIMSIQYHSEASPGPLDNVYLFSEFLAMVKETR